MLTTRIPLRGLYPLSPGDVVLLIHGTEERYVTVAALTARGLTTATGARWRIVRGARLCWVTEAGGLTGPRTRREHVGAVGLEVRR